MMPTNPEAAVLFYKIMEYPDKVGILELDITLEEQHDWRSRVTTHPVEDGSFVSDHIFNEPERVTITGFVTNTPLRKIPNPFGFQSIEESIIGVAGAFFDIGREERVGNALRDLAKMRAERQLVDVVTQYGVYRDMALESISLPRDRNTGAAIRFQATLIHINKVDTETIRVNPEDLADIFGDQGEDESDQGEGDQEDTSDGGDTDSEDLEDEASTLYEILEAIGLV